MARGSRRFEFGWLEVLGLILVFAGGSAIVFLLGIFVGKGLQEREVRSEETIVRLPVGGEAVAEKRPSREPSRPAVAPVPTVSPAIRLAVKPAPTASPVPRPTSSPSPAPKPPASTRVPVLAGPTAAPSPPAPTQIPVSEDGRWAVQVNATKDAGTARRLIFELRQKGYSAYLVEVRLRGETWYRVRVGRFATMAQATGMVVRLKNKERYPRAFLVEE